MTEAREKHDRPGGGAARAHAPVRTCAGCGREGAPGEMVRFVLGPDGEVAIDMAGGAFGRGSHVHPDPECLGKACKGGFARSFKGKAKTNATVATVGSLADQIVAASDRRASGLLLAARRAGRLAVGAESTLEALAESEKVAVVVAVDAGSVAQKSLVANAVASGRAVAWGNKSSLGALLGRDEVAVCAVRDAGIAAELIHVMAVRSRCFACRSEVR